ncbi:hypothetical protein Slala05_61090 [Streptomyces lavendulae subsp. lavendulae]|nr:hypothetical protein Slala05_61090 [Streptomyces lavendulae subsp. lavendulae]
MAGSLLPVAVGLGAWGRTAGWTEGPPTVPSGWAEERRASGAAGGVARCTGAPDAGALAGGFSCVPGGLVSAVPGLLAPLRLRADTCVRVPAAGGVARCTGAPDAGTRAGALAGGSSCVPGGLVPAVPGLLAPLRPGADARVGAPGRGAPGAGGVARCIGAPVPDARAGVADVGAAFCAGLEMSVVGGRSCVPDGLVSAVPELLAPLRPGADARVGAPLGRPERGAPVTGGVARCTGAPVPDARAGAVDVGAASRAGAGVSVVDGRCCVPDGVVPDAPESLAPSCPGAGARVAPRGTSGRSAGPSG